METDPGLWKQISGWLWALLLPIGAWAWKKQDAEIGLHRGYFAKVFDKMEEHSRRDEELFRNVMEKMGDNHAEILRALGNKADRK